MAEAPAKGRSRRGTTPGARERELKRLKLSVCDDVGFRLLVATYDRPRRRDELIAQVVQQCEAEKVRVTRLDLAEEGPETNLVGLLRAHVQETNLPPGWRQAVMVTDIERRIDYSSGREGYAFLHQANLLRDALPHAAPMPVVLWLSRIASAVLPAEAPDLWDWRAANFDFTGDESPRLQLLRELTMLRPEQELGVSGEHRRARAKMLEDLLAELEREGPPKTKRQAAERANLLLELGGEIWRLGRAAEAISHFEQALEAYREMGNRRGEAYALGSLGITCRGQVEPRQVIRFHEQALEIMRKLGDRRGEGMALINLGQAWADLGELREAIANFEQALAITRELGDRGNEAMALIDLGQAWADLGELRGAIANFEQALMIAREIGDQRSEGAALGSLGKAWSMLGEPRRAIEFHEQALTIARKLGDQRNEGAVLWNLGLAWGELGEPRRTIEYCKRRLEIARAIGDRRGEGNALFVSALALDDLGEREEAVRRAREALASFEALGANHSVDRARALLAQLGAGDAESNEASVETSVKAP